MKHREAVMQKKKKKEPPRGITIHKKNPHISQYYKSFII